MLSSGKQNVMRKKSKYGQKGSNRLSAGKLLLLLTAFYSLTARAQHFEFQWSDEKAYSNSKEGFFAGFIGSNSAFVYTINTNYAKSHLNYDKKLMLKAYNNSNMVEAASVALRGFDENEATYAPLHYYKTVVMEDKVLVFWTKMQHSDTSRTEELFVESFTSDELTRLEELKLVYTAHQCVERQQSDFTKTLLVVASNRASGSVLIGSEFQEPGKPLVFRCKVLNERLSPGPEFSVELPQICEEIQRGLLSVYEYGADGNVYIRSWKPLPKEIQRQQKQYEARKIPILTILNPSSGKFLNMALKGEQKTITDYSFFVQGKKTRVVGFFGDFLKDTTGIDKQGLFYADIDNELLEPAEIKYTYFEKTTLNRLFPRSKGGRRKNVDTPSLEEQLNTRFDIEYIFPMEDSSLVLFFTRKYNYSEITSRSGMNGRNIYDTAYYCEKNNVSAIRFSEAGKIMWTGNFERHKTYEGTDIADLRIVAKQKKFYVIYGFDPEKPPKKKSKKPDFQRVINYTTFDPITGKAKKFDLNVNEADVPREEWKYVDPTTFYEFDNQFYHSKMLVKQKAVWYAVNVVFFPSIYYTALSGNTKVAKGELGTLKIMDGKPPKKKPGSGSR